MLKPGDVFQPKAFPKLTYIDRSIDEDSTYEEELQEALEDTGTLVVITGASKSGKTVLCHKVVERERYISLSGSQIQSQTDFWEQMAEQLDLPAEWQITDIIDQDKIVVIDDFHYIEKDVQKYIARTIKTELFNGLKAIILTLPHRSDDAIRLNPDLIGRTAFIDITPWPIDELKEIAIKGFALLGIEAADDLIAVLAQESIASPQLMQENCLRLANLMVKTKTKHLSRALMEKSFRLTAKNYDYYASILGTASKGPLQGQKRRTIYTLKDGKTMDIYGLLFESIAKDPPITALSTDAIKERFAQLLADPHKMPTALNIANSIKHIEKIIKAQVPSLDTIEWKDGCLYILDPFLLFYLSWGGVWQR